MKKAVMINPTNIWEIKKFLIENSTNFNLLKEACLGDSYLFEIKPSYNTFKKNILISVEYKCIRGSFKSFEVKVSLAEKKVPFLIFILEVELIISSQTSNVIHNIQGLPSMKKDKKILAFVENSGHFLYQSLNDNSLGLDWHFNDFDTTVQGYFFTKDTVYLSNEKEFEKYMDNIQYDVSSLVPKVIEILLEYLNLDIDEKKCFNILQENIGYLNLIGETPSSIDDTLPRENIISLFKNIYQI
jgi:hypothetical protein